MAFRHLPAMAFYTSGPSFDFKMLPPGANCLNCGAPGEGRSTCGYCGRFRSARSDDELQAHKRESLAEAAFHMGTLHHQDLGGH